MDIYAEKLERIKRFRPIDDIFFEVLARDKAFDQEMLRIIMADNDLIVVDVIVQSDERNLYGRSVRLDALCILGDGSRCNVEVQRSNSDDHLRRVRYNASMITVKDSDPGTDFSKIPEVHVVYISEFDIFGKGRSIYHVEKTIRETSEHIDDGLHEIFVNTKVNDGTELASYMAHFTEMEVEDKKFPAISNAVNYLKHTEGGLSSMCQVMEEFSKEVAREAAINATIKTAFSFNAAVDEVARKIETEFSLTEEAARKCVQDFLNSVKPA